MTEHYQFYRRGSTSRGDSNTLPSSPATHPTTTTQDSATRPAVSDDACRNDSDFYSSSGGTLDVPVASGSYPPEYAFVKFEDAQYAEVPHQQDLYTEHSSYADQQQWQPTDRFPDMFAHTAESLPRFDLAVMMAQAEQSSNADSRQEQQLQVPFLNITNDEEFNPTLDALLSSPECQDDLIHIARTLGVDVPSSPAFSTAGQFRHQSSFTAHSNNEAEGFAGGSWQASYPSLPFQMFGGIENGEEIRLSDQQFRAVPASPIGHIGHDSRHADSQLSPASPFLSPGLSEDDDQLTVNDWVRDEAAPQSPWKSLQVLYDTQRGAESGMPSSIVKMEDILSGEESPIYSRECDSSSASSTSPAPFLSREPTRQSRTPGIIVSPYLESPTPKLESPTPKLEYFGDTGLQPTRKRGRPPKAAAAVAGPSTITTSTTLSPAPAPRKRGRPRKIKQIDDTPSESITSFDTPTPAPTPPTSFASICIPAESNSRTQNRNSARHTIESVNAMNMSNPATRNGCYLCKICHDAFRTRAKLKNHASAHSWRPYQCDHCLQKFARKYEKLRHERSKHLGIRPYKCHLCHKSFSRTDALARHMLVEAKSRGEVLNDSDKNDPSTESDFTTDEEPSGFLVQNTR